MKTFKIVMCAIAALFISVSVKAQNQQSKDNLLTSYYALKGALESGDATTATTKAKELDAAITGFSAAQLAGAEKEVWTKQSAKLQSATKSIASQSTIEPQRVQFAALSQSMFEVVKALKLNTAAAYWQYCPMKKMYWLSNTSAIENPYYGNQMLTCGSVKETLPAAK